MKVAAIVDWFGITDVNDMLEGPNRRDYALLWLGSQPLREQIAKRGSPLTYVRPGLPPILIAHGDPTACPILPIRGASRSLGPRRSTE